jgi:hypothetical protein
MRYEGARKE